MLAEVAVRVHTVADGDLPVAVVVVGVDDGDAAPRVDADGGLVLLDGLIVSLAVGALTAVVMYALVLRGVEAGTAALPDQPGESLAARIEAGLSEVKWDQPPADATLEATSSAGASQTFSFALLISAGAAGAIDATPAGRCDIGVLLRARN